MKDRESIYLRLPIFLQNIACSVEGWRIQRFRHGRGFQERLRESRERLSWSGDQIREFRDARLKAFVEYCAQTVPFYRELFRERGIDPHSIRSLEDLKAPLPILDKATLQQRYPELISEAVPERQRVMIHTSGTTGGGLRFATTWNAIHEHQAIWWRYRNLHGLQQGTWCGYFCGRSVVPLSQKSPPFWRYNIPGRQILFSGYHISSATFDWYIKELEHRKPPWLHGYPSLLALVGSFLLENHRSLGYRPAWITTGAENLLPQQAQVIERAFGIRPVQHYGVSETIANFSECTKGKLHVDEDFAATEFIPIPGETGFRVVGSNFTNSATTLLRYDIGDVVELDTKGCDCGLPGRIVGSVDGRREDYVILRNGARLGRLDHIFKDLMTIREAQIIQDESGAFTVRVVRNASYNDSDETLLRREIHKRVGDLADFQIEYVDQMQRSKTGKFRFVVSRVREGRLVSDGSLS